jgi:ComF family protein
MKYHRRRAYARAFGQILSECISFLPDDVVVMPIPTANNRIRQRGFDQAHLIAKQLVSCKGLLFQPGLYRKTQVDQIGKNRTERQQQIKRSIALNDKTDIIGKTVLLVDDVLTTGASIEAAAQLLRRNGARHVDAAVVARHLIS